MLPFWKVRCIALSSIVASTAAFSFKNFDSIIAFGDSYTYVQGLQGRTNYSFIGDLQNLPFTREQLLSNAIVQNQTSTASGGPNWVELLTGCGLRPGITRPLDCEIPLWNFAFGGAGVSEDFLPLHHDYTTSLEMQIWQFLTYGDQILAELLPRYRYLIASWVGINDINDSRFMNVSFPEFYALLQDRHFELMEQLYDTGFRQFLFVNLPPLDRNPANLKTTNPLPSKAMIDWFNDTLSSHASTFATAHEDADVFFFDVNAALNSVLDNPAPWNLTNTTEFCPGYNQPDIWVNPGKYGCQPQNEYFWFNSGHLTSRTHEIFAEYLRGVLRSEEFMY